MDPIKVLSSSIACFGVMALATPNPANAAYDPSKPGYTEVINCPTSSFTNFWGHSSSQWGSSGSWISNDTGTAWWSYASTGDLGSTSCGQWTNGTLVGGATYTPGTPSVPQGVTAKIATYGTISTSLATGRSKVIAVISIPPPMYGGGVISVAPGASSSSTPMRMRPTGIQPPGAARSRQREIRSLHHPSRW